MREQHYSGRDAEEYRQFKKSTSVDKDALLDNLLAGTPIPKSSPFAKNSGLSNESSLLPGLSLDNRENDIMFKTAAVSLGIEGINSALHEDPTLLERGTELIEQTKQSQSETPKGQPQTRISMRQYKACQKFPALVEFLGTDDGEKIAQEIAAKVNELLVVKLGENAKSLSKYAFSCKAEKQNIKQYYIGENSKWACQVIATGPFRGDEAIYYNARDDKSYVLRLRGKEYEDVSSNFNLVHELAVNEEIPAPEISSEPQGEQNA